MLFLLRLAGDRELLSLLLEFIFEFRMIYNIGRLLNLSQKKPLDAKNYNSKINIFPVEDRFREENLEHSWRQI